jgi:hypothetical protein
MTRDEEEEEKPTNWAAWIVGGVLVTGAVVGGVLLVRKYVVLKEPAPKVPGVPTEPTEPTETLKPAPIPVPTKDAAEAPQPTTADGEPVAGSEAPDLVRHGVELNAGERSLAVRSFPQWRNWASQQLPNLRFMHLPARNIADKLWRQAFPELPERLSQADASWTVNGRPYPEIIENADAFLRAFRGGFFQPKHWNPQDTFARVLVGEGWVPYRQLLGTLPPAASVEYLLDHVVAAVPRSQTHPGLGQSVTVWDWFVWPPGVSDLHPSTVKGKGTEPKRTEAMKQAVEAIRRAP